MSFEAQKLFILMMSDLFFSWVACAFDVMFKELLLIQGQEDLELCLVLDLTFKSLTHFMLIFYM